jgi:hypothetical protein
MKSFNGKLRYELLNGEIFTTLTEARILREDHFIPFKMHDMQVRALTNARSITSRIFTKEDQAQNHCQIGSLGLALDATSEWLEKS